MKPKTVNALVVGGGTYLLLNALRKPAPAPQLPAAPMPDASIQQWSNGEFNAGLVIGAVSMGAAWLAWNKGKQKLFRFTAPTVYKP